jgi:hypothetical protein
MKVSISSEQLRILVAAAEGRLKMKLAGRYEIEGEPPPARRDREKLQKRGLLTRPSAGGLTFTEAGLNALRSARVIDDPPLVAQQLDLAAEVDRG